ncbi:hydrogenase maturation nickel metallochaperone HypA [Prosthecochloris sp. GSB1]|uniref:hydrogenase maturation nickel metallochaperone HypA n=1 Tax=Prosthecochloris sp. GSB1 TaxID=281093 RepID=UPI00142DB959|nr:hydrogenase maturation nickel metallochaperone HypA [Prosthecochloris sp. GSB1]
MNERTFTCADCGHEWSVAFGTGRPANCPECNSEAIHRKHAPDSADGFGRGQGRQHGLGRGGRGACGAGRPGKNMGTGAMERGPSGND